MRILADNTLAIAIDFQERLMPAMHDKDASARNAAILLSGLEALQVPVIVSRQYPKGLGDTVETVKAVTGNAMTMDKTAFSCYADEAIKKAVDGMGRKNVIVCGVEAHVCVLQTAVDLQQAGFQVVYVTDCADSRKAHDKKYGIKRVAAEGALLVTYEQILFELTQGATSPAFKTISNLVK